jgi:hypothetical protein
LSLEKPWLLLSGADSQAERIEKFPLGKDERFQVRPGCVNSMRRDEIILSS